MKQFLFLFIFSSVVLAKAQNLYFPPLVGNVWDTLSPTTLGYCQPRIDSLYNYLLAKNTKSFILLKNGKIVLEKYFGTYTADSIFYWASAGKSLTGFLTGIAQQKGFININNSVSTYLGNNWSSVPLVKENLIKVVDLLRMTSGCRENPPSPCANEDSSKACLTYSVDANTYWAYHTGAYKQLQAVLSKASGLTYNGLTNAWVENKIGMTTGIWFNGVFYSKARDMARFGLLNLNKGIWVNDTILNDANYFNAMVNTSQNFNLAYGYLWWLNGKATYRLPGINFNFPGSLIPNAPADTYCALGKNDQKIYVVPSQSVVVIRQGNSAGASNLALSSFDNMLWDYINKLNCLVTGLDAQLPVSGVHLYPNPTENTLQITQPNAAIHLQTIQLYTSNGSKVEPFFYERMGTTIALHQLPAGMYYLETYWSNAQVLRHKLLKQ